METGLSGGYPRTDSASRWPESTSPLAPCGGDGVSVVLLMLGTGLCGGGRGGSRLQKPLRPAVLSTPLLPPAGEESLGRVSGQCAHAQPSLLPTPRSQVRGTGSRPRVPTGSPHIKSSEQGVTQNEETRQVGPQPPEVWSHHPRATRESGHPGAGTESRTPALVLPELGWARGPQAWPRLAGLWMGALPLS